ncbi:MAG: CBS domain-containing protein [Saprospiraceae bacterium]|nr:CBS domain-containing protein [Saprospiraceae bacterium]
MGDFRVRKIENAHDRRRMYQYAINDIEAFEYMLQNDMFEDGDPWIGAEQELCIVNKDFDPATSALNLLDSINDEHYTNELALFNLEINLDPLPLNGDCFSKMEQSLLELMQKGYKEASLLNEHIVMTGILPTLKYHHLQSQFMTPIQRYETLSQTLSEIRGGNFEVYMQGVDDLIMSLGSVLFEACNTSFQLHLQIRPNEFVDQHNWSQMIAGPVLSACSNSPLLFGNELWAETRIALFKQSLDTRSSDKFMRTKLPRVYFGRGWMQDSAAELWKNDLMHFPLLVTSDDLKNSKQLLANGEIPDLRGIRLHNGTTYTWNRLCYGFSKTKPHLRIECRYLPSGPSAIDEIANFAFWIGLMRCEPKGGVKFWKNQSFKAVKNNFVLASRSGLNTVFNWYGENIPAKKLILETLIPMARKGLKESGVSEQTIETYLSVIEKRVSKEVTGSSWTIDNFRKLSKHYGEAIALKELVSQSIEYQKENVPLHEWEDVPTREYKLSEHNPTVEQVMSTNIFSVNENSSIEIVKSILDWNGIHHLPVEDKNGDLIGLITDGTVARLDKSDVKEKSFAKDIMLTNLVTVNSQDTMKKAKELFESSSVSGIPVTYDKKLVGMITLTDLAKCEPL